MIDIRQDVLAGQGRRRGGQNKRRRKHRQTVRTVRQQTPTDDCSDSYMRYMLQ